jgi:L-malate glycosyltransferase
MTVLVVSHSCSTPINQRIYREIQRRTGWNITLLIPREWKDEFGNRSKARLETDFSAELIDAPVWGNGSIIFHAYRFPLRRFLRERRFDAIYVNHEPYAIATAQACLANRSTWRVPFGFYSCQNIQKRYPFPFRWMERLVYRSSQFAFPITEEVGAVLRRKGYRNSMNVAPLAFDPALYFPRSRNDPPTGLERNPGEIVIGYVGRIVEAKGLRTLVKALAKLTDCAWRLVVVGTGPFEKEFDGLVAAAGLAARVVKLGFIPHEETPKYLATFDVLVVPSESQPNWKEQFGRVIVEALACGTPVLGSDSGEIPKVISASRGGLIFPERNPEALAGALRRLLGDEKLRLRHAEDGRRWAVANVSLEAVASGMASTIEQAIVSHKSAE